MKKIFSLTALGFLLSINLYASENANKNYCYKPQKPIAFKDQIMIDNYNHYVELYGNCMKDFISEKEEKLKNMEVEVEQLQKTLEKAVKEYNDFVNEVSNID